MFSFHTTWKTQKTKGFLAISGGYKLETLARNGLKAWQFFNAVIDNVLVSLPESLSIYNPVKNLWQSFWWN